jgi:hypothetical protein
MVTCVKAVEGASQHHSGVLVRFDVSHGRHHPKPTGNPALPPSLSDTLLYTLPSRRICSRSFLSEIKLLKIHNTDVELTILNPKTQTLTWQPGTKELRVRIMMMRTCMYVCMYVCMHVCMYECI